MAQAQRFADPEARIVEQHDQERVAREPARLDQPQNLARRQALLEHLLLNPAGIARQIAVLAPRRASLADMLEERLVGPVPVIGLRDLGRIDREVVGAVIEAVERFDRELDLVARRWCQNPRFLLAQQDQPEGLASASFRRASRQARKLSYSATVASWMPAPLAPRKFAKSTTWRT
jgi:hypothetical protein